jgi:hypothetical protein
MMLVPELLLEVIVDKRRFLKGSYPSEFSNNLKSISGRNFMVLNDREIKLITLSRVGYDKNLQLISELTDNRGTQSISIGLNI